MTRSPERRLRTYRYLPAEFHFPVTMQIWHSHVTLMLFGEPVLIVVIKNKDLADSFRVYFELLWKLGKK